MASECRLLVGVAVFLLSGVWCVALSVCVNAARCLCAWNVTWLMTRLSGVDSERWRARADCVLTLFLCDRGFWFVCGVRGVWCVVCIFFDVAVLQG